MPALMIRAGRVMLPSPRGPVAARDPEGKLYDVLEVSDQLAEKYGRLYVMDLDGFERDQPQLDYLQEIARSAEVWIDAGVRGGEPAIDIVVAGAHRTVLSSDFLAGERELRRAWTLSTELAFEVVDAPRDGSAPDRSWQGLSRDQLVGIARDVGFQDLIYAPAGPRVDWTVVRGLARSGPLWVGGAFTYDDVGELQASGAIGGIFPISDELETLDSGVSPDGLPLRVRDDDD